MKQAYKITGKDLKSVNIVGNASVQYKRNEPAIPKPDCGPLCVFKDAESVTSFLKQMTLAISREMFVKVWLCEYEESKEDHIWTFTNHNSKENIPEGTILADEVILKEEVKI